MTKKFTVTSSRDREEHLKAVQDAINERRKQYKKGEINDTEYWFYLLGYYKGELQLLLDGDIDDRLEEVENENICLPLSR